MGYLENWIKLNNKSINLKNKKNKIFKSTVIHQHLKLLYQEEIKKDNQIFSKIINITHFAKLLEVLAVGLWAFQKKKMNFQST